MVFHFALCKHKSHSCHALWILDRKVVFSFVAFVACCTAAGAWDCRHHWSVGITAASNGCQDWAVLHERLWKGIHQGCIRIVIAGLPFHCLKHGTYSQGSNHHHHNHHHHYHYYHHHYTSLLQDLSLSLLVSLTIPNPYSNHLSIVKYHMSGYVLFLKIFQTKNQFYTRDGRYLASWYSKSHMCSDQNPRYLLHLGDYTTHLYRDYYKPLQGSVLDN